MDQDDIVAIALLTQDDLTLLGPTFTRAWPVEEIRAQGARGASEHGSPDFAALLCAIDRADDKVARAGAAPPAEKR